MASPIITPMPVQTDTNYRPISRLAVVGLILSLPSVFIFLNDNLYWLLPALILPAFIICLIALRSIRRSEGSLDGETIALLGIVITVGCGLGWITMTTVTKAVTEAEAKSALDDWISKMFKKESGAAFLLTNDPKYRNLSFNPEEHSRLRKQFPGDNQQTSAYDNFLIDPICGQILRYGDQFKLKDAGLIESHTLRASPLFRFRYEFTSPIAEGSFIVTTRGEEMMTDQGSRRGWKMSIESNATYSKDTPYGQELKRVLSKGQDLIEKMLFAIANDEMSDVVKMFDPKRQGELQTVLGYIRPKGRTGPITPMGMLKPVRLRADQKNGNRWSITIDCTAIVENDRSIDFSVVLVTDDMNTFIMQDCQFLGIRKMLKEPTNDTGNVRRTTVPG